MDPDTLLHDLLDACQTIIQLLDHHPEDLTDLAAIAEQVLALDTWLAGGGFLPRWAAKDKP